MRSLNFNAVAVLFGFALVASAIFISGNNPLALGDQTLTPDSSPSRDSGTKFVYGDKNAALTIVEFSDFECPFCSRVHPTLKRLVDESNGDVKWEYRHLPLAIHKEAVPTAIVAECVGRKLGNDEFWKFTDRIFAEQKNLSSDLTESVAQELGLTAEQISACYNDQKINKQIAVDELTAKALGGSGTPFSVIIYPDGTLKPVSGALPYENWLSLIATQ